MSNTPHIAFTGAPLDLAENQRDASALTAFAAAQNARAIVMVDGKFLVKDGDLVQLHPSQLKGTHLYDPGPLFLGLDGDVPQFAFSLAKDGEALNLIKGGALDHLRNLAFLMEGRQLALAGRAKSLFDWHKSHRFCSNCGVESKPQSGGVTRKCPTCEDGRLGLKLGKFGGFIGCSNYPECRYTRQLALTQNGDDPSRAAAQPDGTAEPRIERTRSERR